MALQVQWQCVDHAAVTRYEAGWLKDGIGAPTTVVPLVRPATLPTPVPLAAPTGFGLWAVAVQAYAPDGVGGEVASGWSDPSAPLVLALSKPSAVTIIAM